MKFKKRGEMAMGTLIIFIAMVLIAAVAAGVLISTTSSLQTKALETGKATRQEVGTNLNVLEVYGEDGSNNDLENLSLVVRLSAGSDPVRFDDLLLSVILDSSTQDLEYQSNSSLDANETHYTVTYSIEGADYTTGYLSSGDVAVLKFVADSAIGESKYVRLSLVPKIGTPATIETQTPDIISRTRQIIFP